MEFGTAYWIAIAIWMLFPLRVLLDRSIPRHERLAWMLACAAVPILGYILFLIARAVRASFAPRQA